MGTYVDKTWLESRITRTKAIIIAYENAIEAVAAGAQSYTLDTGQTRQTVTKANLTEMRNALASYENRLTTLQARIEGAGVYARPGY